MPDDDATTKTAKVTAFILVTTWSVVTLGLTFGPEHVSVPPYWIFFTALVFTIVGKIWDVEVQHYLPTNGGK